MTITSEAGLKAIGVMCNALAGDLLVLRGDLDGARKHFEAAPDPARSLVVPARRT
ncbi:MAG: hypothetical protein R3E66_03470 [bacterium]